MKAKARKHHDLPYSQILNKSHYHRVLVIRHPRNNLTKTNQNICPKQFKKMTLTNKRKKSQQKCHLNIIIR